MKKILSIITVVSLVLTLSCKKKSDDPAPTTDNTGTLVFDFENYFEGEPLTLRTKVKRANGDTLNFSTVKYYVSNFRLIDKNDTTKSYVIANSYYLLDQNTKQTMKRTITGIPVGDYSITEFYIGIDSAANLSLAQPGDLDPNNDMAWNWNTGYIFVKLEGTARAVDTAAFVNFSYHGGRNENYSRVRIGSGVATSDNHNHRTAHGGTIHIKADKPAEAHIVINVEKLLEGETYRSTHNAAKVVQNFPGAVELHHTN